MNLALPKCLQGPDDSEALRLLTGYYDSDRKATANVGAWWDGFDPSGRRAGDTDRFTSDDLVALSLLSGRVPGAAAHKLLVTETDSISRLLAEVGADRDLADQAVPVDAGDPGSRLYAAVRGLPDIGRTRASKLLARKRPRLFPIRDEVVETVLELQQDFWEPLRTALRAQDGALDDRLRRLHAQAALPPDVSPAARARRRRLGGRQGTRLVAGVYRTIGGRSANRR